MVATLEDHYPNLLLSKSSGQIIMGKDSQKTHYQLVCLTDARNEYEDQVLLSIARPEPLVMSLYVAWCA